MPAISDDSERVFSCTRHTISWDRARLSTETIEKLECLGNWVQNDLIRKLYIVVDNEIIDISGNGSEVPIPKAHIIVLFVLFSYFYTAIWRPLVYDSGGFPLILCTCFF